MLPSALAVLYPITLQCALLTCPLFQLVPIQIQRWSGWFAQCVTCEIAQIGCLGGENLAFFALLPMARTLLDDP
jgi:hypothetical protein